MAKLSIRSRPKGFILIALFLLPLTSACHRDDAIIVSTSLGDIQGTKTETAYVFLGIPFAKPPLGELRWASPQDPEPWQGFLNASTHRDVCTQPDRRPTGQTIPGAFVGSEDCLYLDVYHPRNQDEALPVYVYFHGGANRFGGAADYDGSRLAEEQNIVVVVPQYRLGPLGWLRHPAFRSKEATDPADASGNFGLLDNIKALEWVRDHIAQFGGDPGRVTIGGQSGGSANVAEMLTSPMAEDLFHGAVIQSMEGGTISASTGDIRANNLLDGLGYDPAIDGDDVEAFLRNTSAADLVAANETLDTDGDGAPDGMIDGFADGAVVSASPLEAIFDDDYNKVPVMIGSTASEFKAFMPLLGHLYDNPQWANVYDLFDPRFDPAHKWTWDEIFLKEDAAGNIVDTFPVYQDIAEQRSLSWKANRVDELAKLLRQRQEDVYTYLFQWGEGDSASPLFSKVFGAAHGMDIPFFMGGDHLLLGYALDRENRHGFLKLRKAMTAYLGNFIKTGAPGTVTGITWEAWSNETAAEAPKSMVFDADATNALAAMDTQEVLPGAIGETDHYLINSYGYELLTRRLASGLAPLPGINSKVDAGVHQNAGYIIELPIGWLPGDDLVMYAHGFRDDTPELSVTPPYRLRNLLIPNNYAWAASSYTRNGYDIESGVQSTDSLLKYFKQKYGPPGRIYIVGHSMGGHVAARMITDPQYAGDYTAALPLCGVVGGGTELFSYYLDWGLLADTYAGLGFDVPWTDPVNQQVLFLDATLGGSLGLLPDNDPFGPTGNTSEKKLKPAVLTDAGMNVRAALMYRSGGKRPIFENAFSYWSAMMIPYSMSRLIAPYFSLEPQLGTIAGNETTIYHLDEDNDAVSEAESLLNETIQRVPDPEPDNFEALMWPVSGELKRPVLSLHNIGDLFVPFAMEQRWAERITAVGKQDLFVSRAIRAVGHCDFTVDEEQIAFMDLVDWVNSIEAGTGYIPDGDDILDPAVVADPAFGCKYTSEGRLSVDPDFDMICY